MADIIVCTQINNAEILGGFETIYFLLLSLYFTYFLRVPYFILERYSLIYLCYDYIYLI